VPSFEFVEEEWKNQFDPKENLVLDKRSDLQKVTDILRIWSQLLTSEEQEIWNNIAERDLTRDISLESGIKTPKCFIENEIKAFKDLKKKDQNDLVRTLHNVPKTFQHLKDSYFFKTSGEKFKLVRQDGRCFSKSHLASACKIYTRPTPSPCKFCIYLFHASDNCRFYDQNGKS
jgi:hypothetical protein